MEDRVEDVRQQLERHDNELNERLKLVDEIHDEHLLDEAEAVALDDPNLNLKLVIN